MGTDDESLPKHSAKPRHDNVVAVEGTQNSESSRLGPGRRGNSMISPTDNDTTHLGPAQKPAFPDVVSRSIEELEGERKRPLRANLNAKQATNYREVLQ